MRLGISDLAAKIIVNHLAPHSIVRHLRMPPSPRRYLLAAEQHGLPEHADRQELFVGARMESPSALVDLGHGTTSEQKPVGSSRGAGSQIPAHLRTRTSNRTGSNKGIEPENGGFRRTMILWRGRLPRYGGLVHGIAESEFPGGRADPLQREAHAQKKHGRERGGGEDRRTSRNDGLPQYQHESTVPRLARPANRGERECKGDESRRMERSLCRSVGAVREFYPGSFSPGRQPV